MRAIRQLPPSVDPGVFSISAAIALLFVLWGVIGTDSLARVADTVLAFIIRTFDWAFVLTTFAFLAFAVFLALSRYGRIRLGEDDDRPEFRTASWVAMMFSAGMGIGLMFYGVAEPLAHLAAPPNDAASPNTPDAARVAMELTYFHWTFHPWALYAVVGLSLAYFSYRRGMPNLISSAFYPLIGERIHGPIGKSIEILAVFATLFGSATSLGLGALQINSGLHFLWDVSLSDRVAVVIIAVLTGLFVLSALSGVERGIQWLSNTNMALAALLLAFVLVVGPTVYILDTLTESVGSYVSSIVPNSFRTGASGNRDWLATWTIFYWAWWISWAPFVGTFIARISKGRTIGEFVFGVMLIPSGVSMVWFAILGGTAIDLQLSHRANLEAAVGAPEVALFSMLGELPASGIASFVAIMLVALFFISGADAAALVMAMLCCRGNLEPPRVIVAFWGVIVGAAAAVLLLAGGLTALQQASIIAAAPFTIVMIGLCIGLRRALRADADALEAAARARMRKRAATAVEADEVERRDVRVR
jgi:choline/carnitine/betaine transport